MRAALDPAAKLANPRTQDNQRVVDVTTAERPGSSRWRSMRTSRLPTRVVSMSDNTNLGDVAIETSFADYQDAGGLKLPARLTTKTDKYTTAEIRVTRQTVDGDDRRSRGARRLPRRRRPVTGAAAVPPSTVEEVAKGIWFLAGQSHHSVLVEFSDHLMLIEAPQNDTRTLAVIAKAKRAAPGQAADRRRQQPPPLRSFRRDPGRRGGGLTVAAQKASGPFFTDAMQRSAHDCAGRARRGTPGR